MFILFILRQSVCFIYGLIEIFQLVGYFVGYFVGYLVSKFVLKGASASGLKAGPNKQNHSWKSCRGAGPKSNTLPRKWPRRTTKDRNFKPCAVKVCRWRSNERAARKRTKNNHHHHHHHHHHNDDKTATAEKNKKETSNPKTGMLHPPPPPPPLPDLPSPHHHPPQYVQHCRTPPPQKQ